MSVSDSHIDGRPANAPTLARAATDNGIITQRSREMSIKLLKIVDYVRVSAGLRRDENIKHAFPSSKYQLFHPTNGLLDRVDTLGLDGTF